MRKMKDSGIVRLGLMPKEWSASRVKYIYSVIGSGTTPSSGNTLYYDGTENWIQSGDLYKRKYVTNTEKTVTDFAVSTISALHKYKADFIVIAMYGASIGNVAISKIDACVNQACCVIKPNSKVNFNYLYYTLVNDKDIMLDMSIGGTQPNISQAKILELPVFLPPFAEQQKIADFLDEKCGEIDSIRSDIQKQIDILNDYKKSVITEAVTKGLNPKAKLKDSGIEWIGKIPEGWDVKPNKRIMKKLKQIKSKYEGEPILSLTMNGVVVRDLDNLVGKRPASFDGYQIIKPGNLLMCLFDIDVTPRCIGLIKNKGLTSPAYSHFALENIAYAPYYYYYYLFLDMTKELLHLAKNLRHSLTEDDLGAIKTVIPPLSEQKAIADYLDEKCSEIDATIADKQKQLETLDEYKKSLIFEYVTGKKEVLQ